MAMPDAKAVTIATAGSLIRGALALQEPRCDTPAGRDRKSPWIEYRSGGPAHRRWLACEASATKSLDRGRASTDRRTGTRFLLDRGQRVYERRSGRCQHAADRVRLG